MLVDKGKENLKFLRVKAFVNLFSKPDLNILSSLHANH
ncbi:hypothetical protein ES332_A12G001600v1 [Gossypium tomentosum]|uniref:Uncharacterized protein n=1 Tax=Gossypium tomentosum TaxID=34277 RepID=A0A5D2MQR1_GOSTO|nr:hypothetical protein ES332_A12G001600v1 [Gossypium tomentosum]